MKAVAFLGRLRYAMGLGQQGEVVVIDVDPLAQVGAAFLLEVAGFGRVAATGGRRRYSLSPVRRGKRRGRAW